MNPIVNCKNRLFRSNSENSFFNKTVDKGQTISRSSGPSFALTQEHVNCKIETNNVCEDSDFVQVIDDLNIQKFMTKEQRDEELKLVIQNFPRTRFQLEQIDEMMKECKAISDENKKINEMYDEIERKIEESNQK